MPGCSVMGRFVTFDNSSVMWPEKPGSMKPAVDLLGMPICSWSDVVDLVHPVPAASW